MLRHTSGVLPRILSSLSSLSPFLGLNVCPSNRGNLSWLNPFTSMKSKIACLTVLIVVLLAGCATAEKLNDVRIGMTKDQVIALLGTPDSTSAQANVEYLTYYLENDENYG